MSDEAGIVSNTTVSSKDTEDWNEYEEYDKSGRYTMMAVWLLMMILMLAVPVIRNRDRRLSVLLNLTACCACYSSRVRRYRVHLVTEWERLRTQRMVSRLSRRNNDNNVDEGTNAQVHSFRSVQDLEDWKVFIMKCLRGFSVQARVCYMGSDGNNNNSYCRKQQTIDCCKEDEYSLEEVILVPMAGVEYNSSSHDQQQLLLRPVSRECVICLNDYNPEDLVTWSSNSGCQHVFHNECIVRWLLRNDMNMKCPICRSSFIDTAYITQQFNSAGDAQ